MYYSVLAVLTTSIVYNHLEYVYMYFCSVEPIPIKFKVSLKLGKVQGMGQICQNLKGDFNNFS